MGGVYLFTILFLVKTYALFLYARAQVVRDVFRFNLCGSNGVMRFSCVASAAHFFILRRRLVKFCDFFEESRDKKKSDLMQLSEKELLAEILIELRGLKSTVDSIHIEQIFFDDKLQESKKE